MNIDERYMRRALELAAHGEWDAHPNPMVGAVIVDAGGKIIGEGWHRCCGQGHAEVNAVASVKCRERLKESTMYVTLEPCSHYGKTPPCADLIVRHGIRRVVVGSVDPFAKVSGRGIAKLRDAGVDVTVGVLEGDCRRLNEKFFKAHMSGRPWVTLKWAEDVTGHIDGKISTPLTQMLVHRQRALHQAIMVGSGTVLADDPMLDTRKYAGRDPIRIVVDRRGRVAGDAKVFRNKDVVYFTLVRREDLPGWVEQEVIPEGEADNIGFIMGRCYERGIVSVLVEGGASLLQSFIDQGVYDAIRVERGAGAVAGGLTAAPTLPNTFLNFRP